MDDLRVTGNPDAAELAALVAVLAQDRHPAAPGPVDRWRERRCAALRRTAARTQQTR